MNRVIWLLFLLAAYTSPTPADNNDQRIIEVVGTGTITREPNRARISFSVETQAETAREAADQNGAQTTQLISALEEHGIQKSNLRTRHYRLSPATRPTSVAGRRLTPSDSVRITPSRSSSPVWIR